MILEQILVGSMDVFCYILVCEDTREAIIIDPGGDEGKIFNRCQDLRLTLKYIVNTHAHADHVSGNKELKRLTQAKIVIHEDDASMLTSLVHKGFAKMLGLTPSPKPDMTVKDNDIIKAGNIELRVIHTPGHSPGGMCLYDGKNLFTGDTLFVGEIGRTDLPGASYETLIHSLINRLAILPDETIVCPGHNYGATVSSTIEREKQQNPYIRENLNK